MSLIWQLKTFTPIPLTNALKPTLMEPTGKLVTTSPSISIFNLLLYIERILLSKHVCISVKKKKDLSRYLFSNSNHFPVLGTSPSFISLDGAAELSDEKNLPERKNS